MNPARVLGNVGEQLFWRKDVWEDDIWANKGSKKEADTDISGKALQVNGSAIMQTPCRRCLNAYRIARRTVRLSKVGVESKLKEVVQVWVIRNQFWLVHDLRWKAIKGLFACFLSSFIELCIHFLGLPYKIPQTGWLKTTEIILAVLESRSLKPGVSWLDPSEVEPSGTVKCWRRRVMQLRLSNH